MPAFQGLLKDCEAEVRAAAAGKVKGNAFRVVYNNYSCGSSINDTSSWECMSLLQQHLLEVTSYM